jgi:hypothetical protein
LGPGFKYHVVTVAAIFFALTVGLVVGSLYVSPQLADRQTRAIVSLRNTVNKDIVAQRKQIDTYQKFVSQVLPALLSDKLTGVSVAIVQTGDYPDALNHVHEALQMAGAKVLSITTIDRAFDRTDAVLMPALTDLHNADPRIPTDRAGLASAIAAILAQGTTSESLLPVLEREKFLRADPSGDYQTGARYVVVVGGSRNEVNGRVANVDQPLVTALQKSGVTVVACEPQDALVSDIKTYHDLNLDIATVDNVDTDIGRCALVFALRGEKDDYGVKPTANHLIPSLVVKQTGP